MFKLFYPEETSKISNIFFVIKSFFSNVFVFTDGDNSFCVDAGYSPESLKKGLRCLNIDPQSIRSVFLTHSDFDHVGGLSIFSKAQIYLNKNEEQMIKKRTPRFLRLIYNKNQKEATNSMNIIKNLKGISYICTSHFGIHKTDQPPKK